MATKQPIDPGIIARVTGAIKALTGKGVVIDDGSAWFGPLNPLPPNVPEAQDESVRGRQFDFPSGQNIRQRPRAGEAVTFEQMRALADNCDVLRLVIETRKDQVAKMKFSFKLKKEGAKPDARCQELEDFFALPDGENNWNDWLRMLMEEMLVTDAACIYPWLTNGGDPYRFNLIDGATIKRVITPLGRTPQPPQPAYQQVLKGVNAVNYTVDELVYASRNKRVHKIYGYSPVEQIIMTVNIAIRRSLHQLQYYTEGSTPDLIFQVPPDWNMSQIKEFNNWWQDSLAGNTGSRRKAQFVPNGVTPINTKEQILKDPYDEWLARIICYCFNVSPGAFVKDQNRATAETQKEMALEEGLLPIMQWIKSTVDLLVWRYFKYQDIEFSWDDQKATDPVEQNKMDDTNVKNGTATINEVRAARGQKPVEGGDVPMVLTGTGYVPIIPKEEPETPPPQAPETLPNGGQGGTPPAAPAAPAKGGKESATAPAKGDKGTKEPPEEPEPATTKIAKAAKRVKPIDREDAKHKELQKQFTDKLAKFLKKQGDQLANSVVNKLGKATDTKEKNPLEDIDWTGWEEIQDLFGEQIVLSAQLGVTTAYAQIDLDNPKALNLANEQAVQYAQDRSAELVGKRVTDNGDVIDNPNPEYSIEDATREMIRGDIATAMEEGLSNDDLADMLRDNYAFSEARAETIARTETALADCNGNMLVYQTSGKVESKQWITGDGCCDECQMIDNEIVSLNEAFSNGLDTPPAHPSCRCDFVPIVSEDEEDN